MIIDVDIDKNDLVDLNEYADWYCSRVGWTREGEVGPDAKVGVKTGSGARGVFDLPALSVEWSGSDGLETDMRALVEDIGHGQGPEKDFRASVLVWGEEDGKKVLWAATGEDAEDAEA